MATHFYHISMSVGSNKTFDEMVRLANAYVKNLQEYSAKNEYSCLAIVCVSQHSGKAGGIEVGYRGKKVFRAIDGVGDIARNPHIHIILLSTPGETLSQYTKKYFSKRGIATFSECCDGYINTAIPYAMEQSTKFRVAYGNIDNLPKETIEEFYSIAENVNASMNATSPVFKKIPEDYFEDTNGLDEEALRPVYKTAMQPIAENVVPMRSNGTKNLYNQLQCNSIYNILYNIIYNNINKANGLNKTYCIYSRILSIKDLISRYYIFPVLNTS